MRLRLALAAFAAAVPAAAPVFATPSLVRVATYDTGLGANGAEIVSIRHSDGLAAVTNIAGSLDILDLRNAESPTLVRRISIPVALGVPNSVAVHPQHDYVLAVTGSAGRVGRVLAYRASDGALLQSAAVGIQPDSIAIAPNGQYAVVANEAEGVTTGNNGGPGSLSLIDLRGFNGVSSAAFSVQAVELPSLSGRPGFSVGRRDDIARLPIDNTPATLEPETVAWSTNSRYAYVTLQENSGVVRLDVLRGTLAFFGLGETTHDADLVNGGGYAPTTLSLTAFREPDGIALTDDGKHFVTADEGDTRNAAGASGPRGGRTLSVFDARTGELVADTGSQIDDAAAAAGLYPDDRSNRGGSEPEVLDLTHHRGTTLAAVGLERANAIALVDVSVPSAPLVVDVAASDIAPEGVKFHRAGSELYVVAANEVSGTVTVFRVDFD